MKAKNPMHMLRTAAISLSLLGGLNLAVAQDSKSLSGPKPDQAGADSSMAKPQPQPGQPQGTTTGDLLKVPGVEHAAKHNQQTAEKDALPILAWTLGLQDEQAKALGNVLNEKATTGAGGNGNVEGLTPAVTEVVPDSIELSAMPSGVVQQMPAAQSYKYGRIGEQAVIVDPISRAIVGVLSR
jgi:hypothetical protein